MPRKLVSWALIALIIVLTYVGASCVCKGLETLTTKRLENIKKSDIGLGYTPKSDIKQK